MRDNRRVLADLFAGKRIRLEQSPFLAEAPPSLPHPFDFDRVEGMLLCLAVGDALGNTTEGMLPGKRKAQHGWIRNYLPHKHVGGQNVGTASDDSQMAFWTLEQLLRDGGLVPDNLSRRFCQDRIFGIGSAVKEFVANRKAGLAWDEAGVHSAGNGALMRIAPVLIPHLRHPSSALWADVALAGMITHNDETSTATCIAFAHLVWEALRAAGVPAQGWWIDEFVRVAGPLEGNAKLKPSFGRHAGTFRAPLTAFVAQVAREAILSDSSILEASNDWGSGAYLLETVPCVLAILERHSANPRAAIEVAVNETKDNDTVGAIVGAAVGALHGRKALPQEWIDGLLGRTTDSDDGRVFALIAETKRYLNEPEATA